MGGLRAIVVTLALTSVMGGCIGSFKGLQTVWEFNREVSDSIVVQELVFLAMVLIPVYEVVGVADLLVLNTLEAITGENPLAQGDTAFEVEGTVVRLRPGARALRVELERDGVVERHRIRRGAAGWEVTDGEGRVLARLVHGADGSVLVEDGEGQPLARHSAVQVDHLVASAYVGGLGVMVSEVARPPRVLAGR